MSRDRQRKLGARILVQRSNQQAVVIDERLQVARVVELGEQERPACVSPAVVEHALRLVVECGGGVDERSDARIEIARHRRTNDVGDMSGDERERLEGGIDRILGGCGGIESEVVDAFDRVTVRLAVHGELPEQRFGIIRCVGGAAGRSGGSVRGVWIVGRQPRLRFGAATDVEGHLLKAPFGKVSDEHDRRKDGKGRPQVECELGHCRHLVSAARQRCALTLRPTPPTVAFRSVVSRATDPGTHSDMRPIRFVVVAALVAAILGVPTVAHAARDTSAEQQLVQLLNQERTARDLPPLRVASDIRGVAYSWSVRMARRDTLGHNPNYSRQICCWAYVGENVARAQGIDDPSRIGEAVGIVHAEFMASPRHRDNILDASFDEVGVGVEVVGELMWVTQNFRGRNAAPQPGVGPAPVDDNADPPASDATAPGDATGNDVATPPPTGAQQSALDLLIAVSTSQVDSPDTPTEAFGVAAWHPVARLLDRFVLVDLDDDGSVASLLHEIRGRRGTSTHLPHPIDALMRRSAVVDHVGDVGEQDTSAPT